MSGDHFLFLRESRWCDTSLENLVAMKAAAARGATKLRQGGAFRQELGKRKWSR